MNAQRSAAAIAAAAAMIAVAVPAQAAPNLVTNGGFEDTSSIAGSAWAASGFSSEGYDFLIDGDVANAHGGSHSFAGGAVGALGYIEQTLATTPGAVYDIRLWLANLPGSIDNTAVEVRWDGNAIYSAADILGFGYGEIALHGTATSSSTVLSIGIRNDSYFLNVDDVSVSAVPEPGGGALWGIGIAAVAIARRRAGSRRRPAMCRLADSTSGVA